MKNHWGSNIILINAMEYSTDYRDLLTFSSLQKCIYDSFFTRSENLFLFAVFG